MGVARSGGWTSIIMSFQVLGLSETCTKQDILKAWRALSMQHHPDKQDGDPVDDSMMKLLNEAKDECLARVGKRADITSDEEFVAHICKVLGKRMQGIDLDVGEAGVNLGSIVRHGDLRKFFWFRTVDAMEWVLRCVTKDREFEQEVEDEIPVLCKFYNEYIGEDAWSEEDLTMMTVLNRYDRIKAGGYGNFARHIVQ